MVAHASSQTMRMHYSWNPIFFSHVQASTHVLELNCRAAKMCPKLNKFPTVLEIIFKSLFQ